MTSSEGVAVFLVRHGQTTWNAESRYQGHLDPPLSDLGEKQVDAVVDLVYAGAFDLVLSSPLSRARVLAERIADRTSAPLKTDQRLIEINLGAWQGMHRDDIEREYRDMFHAWYSHPDVVRIPHGETLESVWGRVRAFMAELFGGQSDFRRICVVTHDIVIKVALMQSLGMPMNRLHNFHLRNASISVVRGTSPTGSVESLDVTDHLTGSPFLLPK